MNQNANLAALAAAGVSVWLDDLSRERLVSGGLQRLIDTRSVVGVTTNPSIFERALTHSEAYEEQLTELARGGVSGESAARTVITDDVRTACDVLRPQFDSSDGRDGRVSIEVHPGLAHHTEATVQQAVELWKIVGRPNLLIKIPATAAGLPAITAALAAGISVNVTLIFSVARHLQVMHAYLAGIEDALRAGRDIARIHSVASLFVSRIDTEVDRRLELIGTPSALALRGHAAVATAHLAYRSYQEFFDATQRYAELRNGGAHTQRLLWASTGSKNPRYPNTKYVAELIAPNTVSTIPENTLNAVADHGAIHGDTITGNFAHAHATVERLTALGIDLDDVCAMLERDGVAKFQQSWKQLLSAITHATHAATSDREADSIGR